MYPIQYNAHMYILLHAHLYILSHEETRYDRVDSPEIAYACDSLRKCILSNDLILEKLTEKLLRNRYLYRLTVNSS